MFIKQLSVFLENKPGRLSAVIDTLASNNVDISALSLADTEEYGVLRIIVDKPDFAAEVLTQSGVIVKKNHVIAIAIDDSPGGTVGILHLLAENSISIEYMYACVGKVSGKALTVIRTDNQEEADRILNNNGFSTVDPSEIYRI